MECREDHIINCVSLDGFWLTNNDIFLLLSFVEKIFKKTDSISKKQVCSDVVWDIVKLSQAFKNVAGFVCAKTL